MHRHGTINFISTFPTEIQHFNYCAWCTVVSFLTLSFYYKSTKLERCSDYSMLTSAPHSSVIPMSTWDEVASPRILTLGNVSFVSLHSTPENHNKTSVSPNVPPGRAKASTNGNKLLLMF